MADPTDTTAIAEIEQLTHCEIEISRCRSPRSTSWSTKGYRQISTAVVSRAGDAEATMFVTVEGKTPVRSRRDSEVSVTAQIPISALQQPSGTMTSRSD